MELCMMPVRMSMIDKLTGVITDWESMAKNGNIDGKYLS
jgi:hypothetical protein